MVFFSTYCFNSCRSLILDNKARFFWDLQLPQKSDETSFHRDPLVRHASVGQHDIQSTHKAVDKALHIRWSDIPTSPDIPWDQS